jgi:hypothetical protein
MLHSWLLSLLFFLQAASPAPQFGSIEGIVRDDHEEPLPDAIVYAMPELDMLHDIRTATDRDGRFRLDRVPPGGVYVRAYKESAGYPYDFFSFFDVYDRPQVKVDVAARRVTGNVVVRLGARAARLNIEITGQDGALIKGGARLSFDRDDIPGPYRQGSAARESLLVPPVPFRLTVQADGYEPWTTPVSLKSLQTLDLTVRLRPVTGSSPQK